MPVAIMHRFNYAPAESGTSNTCSNFLHSGWLGGTLLFLGVIVRTPQTLYMCGCGFFSIKYSISLSSSELVLSLFELVFSLNEHIYILHIFHGRQIIHLLGPNRKVDP